MFGFSSRKAGSESQVASQATDAPSTSGRKERAKSAQEMADDLAFELFLRDIDKLSEEFKRRREGKGTLPKRVTAPIDDVFLECDAEGAHAPEQSPGNGVVESDGTEQHAKADDSGLSHQADTQASTAATYGQARALEKIAKIKAARERHEDPNVAPPETLAPKPSENTSDRFISENLEFWKRRD